MSALTQAIRLAVRKLVRTPLFTTISLVTLAVGIGANAAIFAVLNNVLLAPLPYADADRLVEIAHTAPGIAIPELPLTDAMYYYYRERATSFERVAIWSDREYNVVHDGRAERVPTTMVTADFFRTLEVAPALGRDFTNEDDVRGAPETVVLSWTGWQRWFGADPDAVGRTLLVDGRPREVIGIMPRGFVFRNPSIELYLPARFSPTDVNTGSFNFNGIARLAPGATPQQASAEVTRLAYEIPDVYPGPIGRSMLEEAKFAGVVTDLKRVLVEDVSRVIWVLFGTVGIVLLIACANVANLFLVRAESRHREIAVRTAMGAGRAAIARDSVLESSVLALAGGALGLGLAWAGLRGLGRLGLEDLPRIHEVGIDGGALLFTLVLSALTGGLLGLIPVFRAGTIDLITALKEGGRGGGIGRERHRARNALVVTQLALALVLLVGAGLMLRTFAALRDVDPGFDRPAELLTARLAYASADFPDQERVGLLHEQLIQRLEQTPGVLAAAITTSTPMGNSESRNGTWFEDFPTPEGSVPPVLRTKWIGGDYFGTLGVELLAGRSINWADMHNRARVAVVNDAFARQFWGSAQAALGRRLRQDAEGNPTGDDWYEIVGVVGDVRDTGLDEEAPAILYMPVIGPNDDGTIFASRSVSIVLRSERPDALTLLPALRDAVREISPTLPLADARTMQSIVDESLARTSFIMLMLAIAAGVALFLGTVGIYGVISYVVSQRTREIGVRMALGARSTGVSAMILRQGLLLAGTGAALGLLAAMGLTRIMAAFLYGVSPLDWLTFLAVAAVLVGTAVIASWLPARRASRIDPVEALRWE